MIDIKFSASDHSDLSYQALNLIIYVHPNLLS